MRLSALTFDLQFSRFDEKVRLNSNGQRFTSFQEGLPAEWEDYKEDCPQRSLQPLTTWPLLVPGIGPVEKGGLTYNRLDRRS